MNILLQEKLNHSFLKTTLGLWTSQHRDAHIFPNSLTALMYCLNNRLHNMQIVASFEDMGMNFTVPVTDCYGH